MKLTQRLLAHNKKLLYVAVFYTLLVTAMCLRTATILLKIPKGFDKLGHICFHIGMVVVWFLYLKFRKPFIKTSITLIQCVILSLFFGIAIEFCQHYFTTTRTADINDVFANIFGSVVGVVVIATVRKYYRQRYSQ